MSSKIVHQCPNCKSKCQPTEQQASVELNCTFSEANEKTKKISNDRIDERMRVWCNAAPPSKLTMPLYPFSLDLQEKIINVRKENDVNGMHKSFIVEKDDDDDSS